jgi:hypothetical protein
MGLHFAWRLPSGSFRRVCIYPELLLDVKDTVSLGLFQVGVVIGPLKEKPNVYFSRRSFDLAASFSAAWRASFRGGFVRAKAGALY